MRVSELTDHGIPDRLVEVWSERQGGGLLSIQRKAIQRGLLDSQDGESPQRFLICAPTGAGKSFCAELVMAKMLTRRQKTVFAFPLKSLAEQKYRQFKQTYGRMGLRVIIATSDRPEFEVAFRRTNYDIALTVYEKLDSLLTSRLDVLRNHGLVVIDEFQTVLDPDRGEVLDRLLVKVKAADYQPTVVGLSAVLSADPESGQRLADWLGATLIEDGTRPVDLLSGVATTEGSWRFRSFNDGSDGEEMITLDEHGDPFLSALGYIKKANVPTLVFLKSRRETINAALQAASALSWPAADRAMARLDSEEPSHLNRTLRQCLSRGVAFHNADLSLSQRRIVEQGFADGQIHLVISTTTLAMGVDLPAELVFLETVKYTGGHYDGRPALVPISRAEFDNMAGRAGRLTAVGQTSPGRAIILAGSDFERDVLWDAYIRGSEVAVRADAAATVSVPDWLLNMVVAGLVTDNNSAQDISKQSLYCRSDKALWKKEIGTAFDDLITHDFLREESGGKPIVPAPLGRFTAVHRVTVGQVRYLIARTETRLPSSQFEWLLLSLSVPGVSIPTGLLSGIEYTSGAVTRMAFERGIDQRSLSWVAAQGSDSIDLDFNQTRIVKAAFLMLDWSKGVSTTRLEESYQVHIGQIQHLADWAAFMVGVTGQVCRLTGRSSDVEGRFDEWQFVLKYGLPVETSELRMMLGQELTRSDYLQLHEAGYRSISALAQAPVDDLAGLITGDEKMLKINRIIETLKLEDDMEQVVSTQVIGRQRPMVVTRTPQSIEVVGVSDGERFVIRIDGFTVRLTGKSFKYFTKLAWARVHRDSGWIYKEDIEVGFNQARYLYRMKQEIAANLELTWPVYENNRLGHYRLMIDPGRVKIDVDKLRDHPDWEVRSLFSSDSGDPVN